MLRAAGRTPLRGGGELLWSVAEGRRGRRWRLVGRSAGGLAVSVLLELDPRSQLARLELDSAEGLVTLHPEPDGASLHGNIVATLGVRPIALPWEANGVVLADSAPVVGALIAAAVGGEQALGSTTEHRAVRITDALGTVATVAHVRRSGPRAWHVAGPPGSRELDVQLDELGRLVELDGLPTAACWPLEEG